MCPGAWAGLSGHAMTVMAAHTPVSAHYVSPKSSSLTACNPCYLKADLVYPVDSS